MTSSSAIHDLLVVGGGINGAGIATDAAGRGLDVVLCEMGDLGSATSSASTKLIHGGLRYLEQYEFSLVRKALAEREVLLRKAPHIIRPLRFLLPYRPEGRPRWMIRAGLWLYDLLGREPSFPPSRACDFGPGSPLLDGYRKGFAYSDAWVDDARLVVLNAMQARDLGATVLTRTRCAELEAADGLWQATLHDERGGTRQSVRARALVNATGPWVGAFARQALPGKDLRPIRLVKGCHIVVPRLFDAPEAYLLQHSDGRVVFVIPYEGDYTLIGTTEDDYAGDPAAAAITEGEIDYLIAAVNEYFRRKLRREEVRHHFAGVRPLVGDKDIVASKVSRDYHLDMDKAPAPMLTVYGGKITTYRKLAESAMELLGEVFEELPPPWTREAPLPGGDFSSAADLRRELREALPWLAEDVLSRWLRQYGSLARAIAAGAEDEAALGKHFGHGLYAREVDYLVEREWALTAGDILWRRTKLGLRFSAKETAALDAWLEVRTYQEG